MDIKRLKNKRLYYPAIFVATLFFFGYGNASASTLQINSNSATLPPGSIMTLSVILNSEGVAINNAEAKIIFPTDLLEVVSINKGNSIFSFWVEEPTYSNLTGTITFNGGIPTPGFNGSSGTVISIVVKVIVPVRFEYVGSSTQKENIEFPLFIETTSNKSVGNMIFASALFMATPSEFNMTDNVIMLPGGSVAELELICNVDALALPYPKKNRVATNIAG